MSPKKRIRFLLFVPLYLCLFGLFYYKYVPLVPAFQITVVPILLTVFLITILKVKRGILLFIFLFPLINNLPYFFGIFLDIPHALV